VRQCSVEGVTYETTSQDHRSRCHRPVGGLVSLDVPAHLDRATAAL